MNLIHLWVCLVVSMQLVASRTLTCSGSDLNECIDTANNKPDVDTFVGGNQNQGTVPDLVQLGFTGLTSIRLSSPGITGVLPTWMASVMELTLVGTSFQGSLPSEWFADDAAVRVLNIRDNPVSGNLPQSLGKLTALEISNTNIQGSIPPSWNPSLLNLLISNTPITGSITNVLDSMTELTRLFVENTQLTGPLPSLNGLSQLSLLRITNNQMRGTLPSTWGNLPLTRLDLYGIPDLSGSIPETWTSFTLLTSLKMPDLGLQGALSNLQSPAMFYLELNNNQFTGTLPSTWSAMSRLQDLYLNDNQLSGTIPSSWATMDQIHELFLTDNNLEGSIPSELVAMTDLQKIYLRGGNDFTGIVPFTSYSNTGDFEGDIVVLKGTVLGIGCSDISASQTCDSCYFPFHGPLCATKSPCALTNGVCRPHTCYDVDGTGECDSCGSVWTGPYCTQAVNDTAPIPGTDAPTLSDPVDESSAESTPIFIGVVVIAIIGPIVSVLACGMCCAFRGNLTQAQLALPVEALAIKDNPSNEELPFDHQVGDNPSNGELPFDHQVGDNPSNGELPSGHLVSDNPSFKEEIVVLCDES